MDSDQGRPVPSYTTQDVAKLSGLNWQMVLRMARAGWIPRPLDVVAKPLRWAALTIDQWVEAGCPRYRENTNS
jgi:predicted DNA-binding transcriptional regulator AlpA